MDAHLRASDSDRQQTIEALHRHTADGRLSLDEFAERVDVVNRARTYGELAVVTADLPTEPAADPIAGPTHRRAGHALTTAAVLAAVLLVVLLGGTAVATAAGWGDMRTMMASMGCM
ncbi:DUF1707 domain-containing protein [Dactylosporangium sp. NPDC051485]|uniref:DUF1707 SHOCT-like domain-containing protein n=1 Tax=Dactylosporangium sp. NPDC051485 TaxID=3154846 RepID=UPI003440F72F